MRDTDRLGQLRDLARLQDVLTGEATAALADARNAEYAAEQRVNDDARSVDTVAEHWYRHLSGPVTPERATAIAALLIEHERIARRSREDAQRARNDSAVREQHWRAASASEGATGKTIAALERVHSRKAEERALTAFADHITIGWMKKK